MKDKYFSLSGALFLMSVVAHAQEANIMHVATKYGETTFDTEIVDSIYFHSEGGQQTTVTMESYVNMHTTRECMSKHGPTIETLIWKKPLRWVPTMSL